MRNIIKTSFSLFLILLISLTITKAQQYHSSIDVRIQYQPKPVAIEGKEVIYYELNVTNHSTKAIDLESLAVLRAKDSSAVVTFPKPELDKRTSLIGGSKEKSIPPGGSAIVYLELAIPDREKAYTHRITYILDGDRETYQIIGIDFKLENTNLILGSPLKGGPWVAIYDPSWERGHRRVLYTMDGKARIPGRFAIDFMQLDADGQLNSEDKDVVANWYGYAADVLAVADGVVGSVKNDFPESSTLSGHPRYSPDEATGNYISIDIGDGFFAFYEHLKPGSITVKPGQKVKKGQMIGKLGFTGQSSGPHLHLHVANRDSPLGAEGVPFAFEHFRQVGFYENLDSLGTQKWTASEAATDRKQEKPGSNTVIIFE